MAVLKHVREKSHAKLPPTNGRAGSGPTLHPPKEETRGRPRGSKDTKPRKQRDKVAAEPGKTRMLPNGEEIGARGPGGRPRGAVSRTSRFAADRYVAEGGLLPIDVMGENMRFFFVEGSKLAGQLLDLLRNSKDQGILTPAHVAEVTKLLNAVHRARAMSQQCAVDLAPYLHARLASITVKSDDKEPITIEYAALEAMV